MKKEKMGKVMIGTLMCLSLIQGCTSVNDSSSPVRESFSYQEDEPIGESIFIEDEEGLLTAGVALNLSELDTDNLTILLTDKTLPSPTFGDIRNIVQLNNGKSQELITWLNNLVIEEKKEAYASSDYYLLIEDQNQMPLYQIAVSENSIRINYSHYYTIAESVDIISFFDSLYSTSDILSKLTIEEAITKVSIIDNISTKEIVLYNDSPAIIVDEGMTRYYNEEFERPYKSIVYCDSYYFDHEYGTTYGFSVDRLFYDLDGEEVEYSVSHRYCYLNYFTGARMPF